MIDFGSLFERRMSYPHPTARLRLDRLVGIDDHKSRLAKVLGLLVNPKSLTDWGAMHHPGADLLLDTILHRPPLIILAGDVGTGKTELAESIGDAVARQENIEIELLPLSLSARGQGKVGQMTQLLSAAFDYTAKEAAKMKSSTETQGAVILLVDEADALAQSREDEMHHEDRSGVNSFIRGIDRLANQRLPAAVIMCTNRFQAIDPAVKRRAAELLVFNRPDEKGRRQLLAARLAGLGFEPADVEDLVRATGPRENNLPAFTYSDLTQRLIPTIVLDAFPEKAIRPARAIEIAQQMKPTAAFREAG